MALKERLKTKSEVKRETDALVKHLKNLTADDTKPGMTVETVEKKLAKIQKDILFLARKIEILKTAYIEGIDHILHIFGSVCISSTHMLLSAGAKEVSFIPLWDADYRVSGGSNIELGMLEDFEITISLDATNDASCGLPDGSVTVSASGGAGTYSYAWSPTGYTGENAPTYSDLPGGTYVVTVTDAAGCTNTLTVNVNNIDGPAATIIASNNVTCFGLSNGNATVEGTGGSQPYTYDWEPNGFTGDGTATY